MTVRCASETARPATSVDFAACEAISPIEAASSSTELAAAVTFSDAAATRLFGGVGFRRHRVGGLVEIGRAHFELHRRCPQLAQRAFDRMFELRDGRCDRVAALLARAARFGLRLRQPFALDHVVAEHDHGARHRADLVARVGRGNARAGVAVGEPLHDAGQAVERPRDAAADQPAEAEAERDHGDADRDDAGARARSAMRQALPTPRSAACVR